MTEFIKTLCVVAICMMVAYRKGYDHGRDAK